MRRYLLLEAPPILTWNTSTYRPEQTVLDPDIGVVLYHNFSTLQQTAEGDIDGEFLRKFFAGAYSWVDRALKADVSLICCRDSERARTFGIPLGEGIVPAWHVLMNFPKDLPKSPLFLASEEEASIPRRVKENFPYWSSLTRGERERALLTVLEIFSGARALRRFGLPLGPRQQLRVLDSGSHFLLFKPLSPEERLAFSVLWSFHYHYRYPERTVRVLLLDGREGKKGFLQQKEKFSQVLDGVAAHFDREPSLSRFSFEESFPLQALEGEHAVVLLGWERRTPEKVRRFLDLHKDLRISILMA